MAKQKKKIKYLDTPSAAIALVNLPGGMVRSIVKTHHASAEQKILNAHYPVDKDSTMNDGRGVCPTVNPSDRPVVAVLVREVIDRFATTCADRGIDDIDALLIRLEAGGNPPGFEPQSSYADGHTCKLYRHDRDLQPMASDLGLAWPLTVIAGGHNRPYPTLTVEQIERVKAIYAPDVTLYDSITSAGLEVDKTAPPVVPPKRVPASVTKRQFRLALLGELNITNEMIVAEINKLADDADRAEALINWEDATTIDRDNPLVSLLGASMSKTGEEIDDLFIVAAKI